LIINRKPLVRRARFSDCRELKIYKTTNNRRDLRLRPVKILPDKLLDFDWPIS
jgi:hypothetical protein